MLTTLYICTRIYDGGSMAWICHFPSLVITISLVTPCFTSCNTVIFCFFYERASLAVEHCCWMYDTGAMARIKVLTLDFRVRSIFALRFIATLTAYFCVYKIENPVSWGRCVFNTLLCSV